MSLSVIRVLQRVHDLFSATRYADAELMRRRAVQQRPV